MNLRTKACLLIAACLAAPALPLHAAERWAELEECVLEAPGALRSAQARCGTLKVPENPDDPDARQLELAWAVSPARAGRPADDPVFFLAGGPGQSARDMLPVMQRVLRNINSSRDLIFLDQRGTGGSNPLDCEFGAMHAFADPDWDEFEAMLRECKDGWDADVRYYTTTEAARDMDTLREHLGLEKINLLGGSYGTRLAQVYLKNHPDRVRSIILDGVVPTRLPLGSEHAEKLDASLEALFEACGEHEECAARFPGLTESFSRLKAQYAEESREITVDDPRTGKPREMTFNDEILAGALRFLAYQPESQMMIPYLVDEAVTTDDPTRLASQMLMISDQMEDMIAFGLNLTVGCSEDWPAWPEDADASGTLMGNAMHEFYERFCGWWPAGQAPADFHEPFDSDVPILLLSGQFDPVTPPEYGDEAEAQFSNSRHLVASGRGHIAITNQCMAGIATQFLNSGNVDDLDTSCMNRLGPEPFFLELLGPRP